MTRRGDGHQQQGGPFAKERVHGQLVVATSPAAAQGAAAGLHAGHDSPAQHGAAWRNVHPGRLGACTLGAGRQGGRLSSRAHQPCPRASPLPVPPQVRKVINEFKVGAPARVGLVAPNDVTIPAGNTGMDPSQTSFFQVSHAARSAAQAAPADAARAVAAEQVYGHAGCMQPSPASCLSPTPPLCRLRPACCPAASCGFARPAASCPTPPGLGCLSMLSLSCHWRCPPSPPPAPFPLHQVLNIPTKINKGSVEITADVHLIKTGDKVGRAELMQQAGSLELRLLVPGRTSVWWARRHSGRARRYSAAQPPPRPPQVGASEATLLSKLGIKPFSYGLIIQQVYDNGSLYDPKVRPRLAPSHTHTRTAAG